VSRTRNSLTPFPDTSDDDAKTSAEENSTTVVLKMRQRNVKPVHAHSDRGGCFFATPQSHPNLDDERLKETAFRDASVAESTPPKAKQVGAGGACNRDRHAIECRRRTEG
jgi:hypothetical protein